MIPDVKRLWVDLMRALVGFCLLVASVCLFWRNNPLLLALMAVECPLALWLWHERLEVSFFLIIAVLGSLAEAVFVRCGVWQYANPTVLGIPLWFPLAFGTTGLIGMRLGRAVAALWESYSPPVAPKG